MMRILKSTAVRGGTLAAIALMAISAPAYAEGTFHGPFKSINPGWDTRNWEDKNLDSAGTTLTIKRCYQDSDNPFTAMNWKLVHNRGGLQPDESLGAKYISCHVPNTGSGNWGDRANATYHFSYLSASDGTDNYYSADDLKVGY